MLKSFLVLGFSLVVSSVNAFGAGSFPQPPMGPLPVQSTVTISRVANVIVENDGASLVAIVEGSGFSVIFPDNVGCVALAQRLKMDGLPFQITGDVQFRNLYRIEFSSVSSCRVL